MRNRSILPVVTTTLALAIASFANVAQAAARSHVEATAIAQAHLVRNTQFDGNVTPFWVGATANRASATVRATDTQLGVLVDVIGRASSRADFNGLRAEAGGELGPLNDFLSPMGSSSGTAMGQLVLDWTLTGAAGTAGSITVSGALFAASYVGNPLQASLSQGSAGIVASLSRDCGGPYCGVYSRLDASASGPIPVLGYQENDYTLTLPVQAGDRVTLSYSVTASANGGAASWAGTTSMAALPRAAIAASAWGAGAEGPAALDGTASFAQQIWLTAGLGLDSTEGLTLLADGHYGFGDVTAVPEPGSWALLLAGVAVLVRRGRLRAADDRRLS